MLDHNNDNTLLLIKRCYQSIFVSISFWADLDNIDYIVENSY